MVAPKAPRVTAGPKEPAVVAPKAPVVAAASKEQAVVVPEESAAQVAAKPTSSPRPGDAELDAAFGPDAESATLPKEPVAVKEPVATASAKKPASVQPEEPAKPIAPDRRTRPIAPDDVIDDFVKRLDESENPFELNIGKKRAQQIASGEKNFPLDTPSTFDVDEPLAVGAENIKPSRAVTRALDPHNRQLLDSPTNRLTKHLREGTADVARHRTRLTPVSVKADPNAIITRRFDEVVELNQIFDEAVRRVGNKGSLTPTALKAAINHNLRDIIKNGSTPAGAAVRDALRDLGFAYVERRGFVMVKATP